MDAYLSGLERAQRRRAGPDRDRVGRVVLRVPGRLRGGQAARRDRHATRRRTLGARPRSPTPAWPTTRTRRSFATPALAGARRARRPPAAPAVGVDGGQGPGLPGHAVRHRARRRGTVNTMPGATLRGGRGPRRGHAATPSRGHGRGRRRSSWATSRPRDRPTTMSPTQLEREGVEKFEASWAELLDTVSDELGAARPSGEQAGDQARRRPRRGGGVLGRRPDGACSR